MQVITLVTDQLLVIEFQRQQMSAAIGQPADPVPIGASGGDALVEGIVFMLPNRYMRFLQVAQVLVFAGVVARTVVEPLQFAGGVLGEQQITVAIIGEGFSLPLQTFLVPGMTGDQAAEWVVLKLVDSITIKAASRLIAAVVVEVVGGLLVETGFLDQASGRVAQLVGQICGDAFATGWRTGCGRLGGTTYGWVSAFLEQFPRRHPRPCPRHGASPPMRAARHRR